MKYFAVTLIFYKVYCSYEIIFDFIQDSLKYLQFKVTSWLNSACFIQTRTSGASESVSEANYLQSNSFTLIDPFVLHSITPRPFVARLLDYKFNSCFIHASEVSLYITSIWYRFCAKGNLVASLNEVFTLKIVEVGKLALHPMA